MLVSTLGRLLAVSFAGLTLAAAGATSAAPEPPPAGQASWRVSQTACTVRGGVADVGGQVRLHAWGWTHVERVSVTWRLHTRADPTWTTSPYRSWTESSGRFPADLRPRVHTSSVPTWRDLAIPDDGFTLVAELTWHRADHADWAERVVVTHCP